jgi:predicted nucleic acid-binding protein
VAEGYQRPLIDSSVFLGGLNAEICNGVKRKVVFDWLWEQAKSGKFEKVFISAITLAEVFKTKKRTGEPTLESPTESLDEFLALIEEEFVEVVEVDRTLGLEAHALCRKYKLWPNDGIQLACALRAHCDVLVIWDRPVLLAVKRDDIRIEEPCIYDRNIFTLEGVELASPEEVLEYERKHPKTIAATLPPPLVHATEVLGGSESAAEEETIQAIHLKVNDREEEPSTEFQSAEAVKIEKGPES